MKQALKWLVDLRFGLKVGGGFFAILALTAIVGLVGFQAITGLSSLFAVADRAAQVANQVRAVSLKRENYLGAPNADAAADVRLQIREMTAALDALTSATAHDPVAQSQVSAAKAAVDKFACDAQIAMVEICTYLGSKHYRRPGFMPGPQALSTALWRRRLFKEYWAERSIREIPELPAERYSAEAGADAMRTYLAAIPSDQRIDLLMCENDILATGAMDVIRAEFGLSIPGDIAVVGFDNVALAAAPVYDLTSYEQPVDEMVRTAVDMILGRRRKETVYLRGRLVPRSSA